MADKPDPEPDQPQLRRRAMPDHTASKSDSDVDEVMQRKSKFTETCPPIANGREVASGPPIAQSTPRRDSVEALVSPTTPTARPSVVSAILPSADLLALLNAAHPEPLAPLGIAVVIKLRTGARLTRRVTEDSHVQVRIIAPTVYQSVLEHHVNIRAIATPAVFPRVILLTTFYFGCPPMKGKPPISESTTYSGVNTQKYSVCFGLLRANSKANNW